MNPPPDIYVREVATYLGLSMKLFDTGKAHMSMIEEGERVIVTVLEWENGVETVTLLEYFPGSDVVTRLHTVIR